MDDPDPEVFLPPAARPSDEGKCDHPGWNIYAIFLPLVLHAGHDAVTGVAIILRDFGAGNATRIDRLTPDEAHKLDLPEGSMAPCLFRKRSADSLSSSTPRARGIV